jgi:16S rRNA (guanine527-N7)-methyltransferase
VKHRSGTGDEPAVPDARLAALAQRHGLGPDAVTQLKLLLELVTMDPLAPTTVRSPARAFDDHLADSLVALELEAVHDRSHVADLGSGAGFPGLPLAIALTGARFTLVESNARKCAFIERAIEVCEVANATVVNARAEAWPEGIAACDLVLARALAPLAVVAEYGAPLLREGGALVIWRGRRDAEDEAAGTRAATELGLQAHAPRHVRPYAGALNRHLQLMFKIAPTPERFPRRPGVARKRPLGSAPSDRGRR